MVHFRYRGAKTREISFPIGGIGTGCIGLAGNGRLIDWEIFNRPAKGSDNGFSSIAVKVEDKTGVLGAKFLHSDLQPPYVGKLVNRFSYSGYGFGPDRATLAGMPHFEAADFEGDYPFARMTFRDDSFPVKVTLRAFNPLIPTNDRDSSIPAAFFEVTAQNPLDRPVTFTAAFNLANPAIEYDPSNLNFKVSQPGSYNVFSAKKGCAGVTVGNRFDPNDPKFGNLTAATDCADVSYQEHWYRGSWFDNLNIFWNDFTRPGRLKNRRYNDEKLADISTLAAHITLAPGEKKSVRFALGWYYPTCENYWRPVSENACGCEGGCATRPATWKNYYASLFGDSREVCAYVLKHWNRLERDSRKFTRAVLAGTMPKEAVEAVLANVSILKTPTCLRLEDGSFYGFEGTNCVCGCCEGSCTHVWNYAYALPFLFPKLERSMRDLDFKYNLRKSGGMNFRLQLPLGREDTGFRACADGQFGGVLKTYREWKLCGDDDWLRSHWEAVKRNIAFAWSAENPDQWDPEQTGVLWGRQHHTLDMELYGPNSWLTGFYLAALTAAAEMAQHLGEPETAAQYREIAEKGKKWMAENLFDGEYFRQQVDLKDKSELMKYLPADPKILDSYWNAEAGEIKYQIASGCAIDQVLAQWHCNLIGLGRIFDEQQTRSALRSVYRYNYRKSFRNFPNPCRLYTLNDEGGTVICSYPKERPAVPITYNDETMYGFEYQVAIHMISEGLREEGEELIRTIRSRFDGEKRNPWNEFECGNNYARSMASYALLNVYSGFTFDMPRKHIGFAPIVDTDCSYFFSLEGGFGTVKRTGGTAEIRLLYGQLALSSVGFPLPCVREVRHNGSVLAARTEQETVFADSITLKAGDRLTAVQ